MQVRDGIQAAEVAGSVFQATGGPLGLVGRVAGLGMDELDAGIPAWAWFGIGVVVGGVGAFLLREKISRVVE